MTTETTHAAPDSMYPRQLMTSAEAADYLNVSEGTMRNWRSAQIGPNYVTIGQRVRYLPQEIEAWVKEQVVHTRSRPVPQDDVVLFNRG